MKSRLNIYHSATLLAILALLAVPALRLAAEKHPLSKYKFIHTRGLVDPLVHQKMYENPIAGHNWKEYKEWCNWNKWNDGIWDDLVDNPANYGIDMPKFTWINSENDTKRIPQDFNRDTEIDGISYSDVFAIESAVGVRQNTHVQEHVLYCTDEDAIYLTPYSDFRGREMEAYNDLMTRWYDYSTDLKSDNLDFSFNSDYTAIETNFGHLGGSEPQKFLEGKVYTIETVADYIKYAKAIENNEKDEETGKTYDNANFIVTEDLNFYGFDDVPPFGTFNYPFTGTFDGGGHIISSLKIIKQNCDSENTNHDNVFLGMFGRVKSGAKIRNIHVDSNCKFKGYANVGFIGGNNDLGDDPIMIENIFFEGTIIAKTTAGGILGTNSKNQTITIENCLFSGNIYKRSFESAPNYKEPEGNNGLLVGWSNNSSNSITVRSCLSTNTFTTSTFAGYKIFGNDGCAPRVYNCFSLSPAVENEIDKKATKIPTLVANGEEKQIDLDSQDFLNILGIRNWVKGNSWPVPTVKNINHMPGAVAKFSYTVSDKSVDNRDKDGYIKDKYIALDISQTYDNDVHVDRGDFTFTEPIIAFRHIFRICDGKKQADEYGMTKTQNKNYIETNRRIVSACKGKNFQIRLDFPVPIPLTDGSSTTKSQRYYLDSDTKEYKNFNRCVIETYKLIDADGKSVFANDNTLGEIQPDMFSPTEEYNAEEGRFARMIACTAPEEGVYQVKIFASNDGSTPLKTADNSAPLQIAEYVVTFHSEDEASVMNEEEYDKLSESHHHTESYLEANCRDKEPIYKDFDEYAFLETGKSDNDFIKFFSTEHQVDSEGNEVQTTQEPSRYFKWPMQFDHSTYGFGYADMEEYNMYRIANHSFATPYHGATKKGGINGPNLYRHGGWETGDGLYDRKYYNTGTKESGYFYYVNAASDPGVICRLDIPKEKMCIGSIVHVSAWFSEFSWDTNSNKNDPELANVILNFQAVMDDGETITLHSFVTGYNDLKDTGNWMHIYYSFVPNSAMLNDALNKGLEVKEYQLMLENNAKNSHGADYAVDDIRVYFSHPNVTAKQKKVFCSTDRSADVEVGIDFETLLATMGVSFADLKPAKDLSLYYAFIDYDKYYNEYKQGNADFEDTFIKYKYDGNVETLFGEMKFSTKYELNPEYSSSESSDEINSMAWRKDDEITSRRTLVFNTRPQHDIMKPGKKYIVALYLPRTDYAIMTISDLGEEDFSQSKVDIWDFDIDDDCAKYGIFTVRPSAEIKIHGEALPSATNIFCCPNQKPEITVTMQDPTAEDKKVDNVEVDWFDGNENELSLYHGEGEDSLSMPSLKESLSTFRLVHPHFKGIDTPNDDPQYPWDNDDTKKPWDNVKIEDTKIDGTEDVLKKEMIQVVKEANESGKLHMCVDTYRIPNGNRRAGDIVEFVIIPIDQTLTTADSHIIEVCMDPVNVTVTYQEPQLNHGFNESKEFKYPEELTNVPLRIGISQIDEISISDGEKFTSSSECLVMPLRNVKTMPNGKFSEIKQYQYGDKLADQKKDVNLNPYWFDYDSEITLASTDDPMYSSYGTPSEKDNGWTEINKEIIVGEIIDIDAHFSGETNMMADGDNQMYIGFYDAFKSRFDDQTSATPIMFGGYPLRFREGYMYTLEFGFSEYSDYSEYGGDDLESAIGKLPPCGGFHKFTLKIVPEYQQWTGKEKPTINNWNNDENWRRVESTELFPAISGLDDYTNDGNGKISKIEEFVKDMEGYNTNANSFAPLNFTKVIIPGIEFDVNGIRSNSVPLLYESPMEIHKLFKGNEVIRILDWHPDPKPEAISGITPVTEFAQFDMAAETDYRVIDEETGEKEVSAIQCVPWYMNTCEQIHFKPDAEIGNQRLLDYEKAWVDVELTHDKWYTLASPLQEVVAGDWYAPTDGARQMSELFQPINFDDKNGGNHRFKPAVYQRAWNKATTKIYEYVEDGSNNQVENFISNGSKGFVTKTEWSHVYNDVEEKNGDAGVGFSIKADGSDAENWDKDLKKVLFRLPKADNDYSYYQHGFGTSSDDNNSGDNTGTRLGDRPNRHRLQMYDEGSDTRITAKVSGSIHEDDGTSSEYFLVGNPFMAHLDMAEFLKENAFGDDAVIEPMFWIMDGKSQKVSVMTGNGLVNWQEDEDSNPFLVNVSDEDCRYIAPMQGFFVKAKKWDATSDKRTLSVVFDEESMTKVNLSASLSNRLKAKTRCGGADDALRISAVVDGEEESQAVLRIEDGADAAFRSGEDVEMFDDDTQRGAARVFTFAGDMAALINQTPELTMTELALLAPEGKDVTLRFDGVDALGEAYLYDAREHSLTSIFDGMEYEVSGNVKSRLYITAGMELAEMDAAISISALGNEVTVIAPDSGDGLTVTVSDMEGRMVFTERTADNGMTFSLPRGVYAVRAMSGDIVKSAKIMIR